MMKKTALALCALILFWFGACTPGTKTPAIPLPEHPRPDFERAEWLNLNGYWSFSFDAAAADKALAEKTCAPLESRILVPFPWGSKLSEVKDSGDVAWYGRAITVPKAWEGKRVFLVVGASDWETSAWLDGVQIGTHQGGYTPFAFELKDVRFGEPQQLLLKADDTASDAHLYGKQGYGNARGIWQTVYLEARGSNYIKSLHFLPDIDASKVRVDVALAQPAAPGECFTLSWKIRKASWMPWTAISTSARSASCRCPAPIIRTSRSTTSPSISSSASTRATIRRATTPSRAMRS